MVPIIKEHLDNENITCKPTDNWNSVMALPMKGWLKYKTMFTSQL